ncbi:vitamin K-dependent protein C-like [Pieris brassicae]|uniref:vitamin K-dependent protein C-like n=1 Tax=Pieris brassicae TaxID=7116 RepID=UPI001E66271E|nr:vitamin K-dependent protein C-like [Pieris brassicae]
MPNHEDSLNKDKLIDTESDRPKNDSSFVSFTASSTTPEIEDVFNFVFPDDNDLKASAPKTVTQTWIIVTKSTQMKYHNQSEFHNDKSMEIKPYKAAPSLTVDYEEYVDLDEQVYRKCGKSSNNVYDSEEELGEVGKGSTPWVALVVLTRSRQSILCYATLVHPRAAVTAADCVHGTSAGEISIIAGIFDLADENAPSQHRVTTVITHPQYKPGQLNHNLAVLHWTRSLILGSLVQPACMSDPYLGDECYFVGWGSYDEAIRQRPRWQRASILSPKVCNARLNKLDVKQPTDAFCASVKTPGSVERGGSPDD